MDLQTPAELRSARACPWCGKERFTIRRGKSRKLKAFVYYAACLTCCARGPAGISQEDAIIAWNDRKGTL